MLVNLDDLRSRFRSRRRSTIALLAMSPRLAPEWRRLFFLIVVLTPTLGRANLEGDALYAFNIGLSDPSGALRSWDRNLRNPCTWFRVTCNAEDRVVRLELGSVGLSGPLAPELGALSSLQYLELFDNNMSGPIPKELGNLTKLVSLNLYGNNLKGPIPDSLGQLSNLKFLRINNNSLSGPIPVSLTAIEGLQVIDLSHNNLSGEVPSNGSFTLFTPISFVGNDLLCGSLLGKQCPGQPPFPLPAPNTQASPPTQEPTNRKIIILASTVSAAALMFVIAGFTFIICRSQKHTGHLPTGSKVNDVGSQKV